MTSEKFDPNIVNQVIEGRKIDNGLSNQIEVARQERLIQSLRQDNEELDEMLSEADSDPSINIKSVDEKVGLLTKFGERIKRTNNKTKVALIGGFALAIALYGGSNNSGSETNEIKPQIIYTNETKADNVFKLYEKGVPEDEILKRFPNLTDQEKSEFSSKIKQRQIEKAYQEEIKDGHITAWEDNQNLDPEYSNKNVGDNNGSKEKVISDNGMVKTFEDGSVEITPPVDNPDIGEEKIIIEGDK